MKGHQDYYATLGVLPIADAVVIRAAYKALAQRYHPDRFHGSQKEITRRMAELNEAYAVLSDSEKRKKYDSSRSTGAHEGSSFFSEESEDAPPQYDPLADDWAIARRFYHDLEVIEARLSRISWRLASSFRAYLLQEKLFERRHEIAKELEQNFLQLYFGDNQELVEFARELIASGKRSAARTLNQAIRVLGANASAQRIIDQVNREYARKNDKQQLMARFGIIHDGHHFVVNEQRFDKLSEAVEYAEARR